MKAFNWGIIGPGSIARDFTEDLKLLAGTQKVTAVLSHRQESAVSFAEDYGISIVHTDITGFLKNPTFDAVYIASPHTKHFEHARACLQKGVAVLCEKPLAINSKQAEELVSISQKTNTFLLEGMWIRFLPSIKQVLELIESDEIGKIISVKASMSFLAPKDPQSRYFDPELGGGSLLDLGVYPTFLSHLLLGKPESISAIARLSDKGIDETCAALFQYKNGQHSIIESSIVSNSELDAEIAGEKGTIKIMSPWNEKPQGIIVTKPGKENREYPCEWKGRGFQFEAEEVVNCLAMKETESKLYPHQLSLDIIKTMDEIRRQVHVKYSSFE